MRIYKTKNYDEMSRKAANIISAQIILKPESVLGLATGSSPIGTYKQLIESQSRIASAPQRFINSIVSGTTSRFVGIVTRPVFFSLIFLPHSISSI